MESFINLVRLGHFLPLSWERDKISGIDCRNRLHNDGGALLFRKMVGTMKIGDLVIDKHFKQYGIVTSEPSYVAKNGRQHYWRYVWVVWHHGGHTQYKTQYLEVVNGGG